MKQRVLHNSRSCYQDSWHTDLVSTVKTLAAITDPATMPTLVVFWLNWVQLSIAQSAIKRMSSNTTDLVVYVKPWFSSSSSSCIVAPTVAAVCLISLCLFLRICLVTVRCLSCIWHY